VRLFVLKPDNIGDFLLACGGIRALAEAAGEENLLLAVKSDVAALARREFPRARVMALPIRPKTKGRNSTASNLAACWPLLLRLSVTRVEASVVLRDKRTFLDTVLWLAPRASRRVACENSLRRAQGGRWGWWENAVKAWFRPVVLPYPAPQPGVPSDLEAHRAVVSEVAGREISGADIMPRLQCARGQGGDHWLSCPFSSRPSKDVPAALWAAALGACEDLWPVGGLRLSGTPDQAERLAVFADELRAAGLSMPVRVAPAVGLEEFPATVAGAGLVLTVDTAAAHLACAVGAPALIVASRKNEGIYAPYSPDGRQVWVMTGEGRSWREAVKPEDMARAVRRALGAG
jgi:ADP-heptose:LPS heptosyltransferase